MGGGLFTVKSPLEETGNPTCYGFSLAELRQCLIGWDVSGKKAETFLLLPGSKVAEQFGVPLPVGSEIYREWWA